MTSSSPDNRTPVQPANQSVYERQREVECSAFAPYFQGNVNALFCVVSQETPSEQARKAIEATAARTGIAASDIFWIALGGVSQPAEELAAPSLLRLIEAIDPLCLVVTEQASARILSLAYNQPIKLDCCDGVLGRPCCAFVDFERMLQTDERKQRAWALLKEILTRVNAH